MSHHAVPSPAASARLPRSRRGSALMLAMIFACAIEIFLVSYIRTALQASHMANRSFYMNAALDLSDLGLEQALWCMNHGSNFTSANFTAVAGSTTQFQATFPTSTTYYTYAGGVTGQVKIWADVTDTTKPHVVVKSIINLQDGSQITKMAEAYMKTNSYFSDGMVGNTITFKGQVTSDSWNSDPNGNGSSIIAYSPSVATDQSQVGATSVQASALSDGQGQIQGSVAAGSSDSSGISLGSQGAVGNASFVDGGNKGIQSGHATYDFTASFPDITAPSPSTVNSLTGITGNTSLPGAGDVAVGGVYYYSVPAISMTGNSAQTLTISGNVVIMTTNTTGTTVDVSGNKAGITIASGGSLKLYTAGDVKATGNGILNGSSASSTTDANQPINFQLYGTRSSATAASSGQQSIEIKGNGYLSGVVYAPNGNVTVDGNGDVLGAIVGHNVVMNGNASFHYDTSLANFSGSSLWGLRKWREIVTPTDQATYASEMSF